MPGELADLLCPQSSAALQHDISLTTASGGKAAPQVMIRATKTLNVCFPQYRTFSSHDFNEIDRLLSGHLNRADTTKLTVRFRPQAVGWLAKWAVSRQFGFRGFN